MIKTVLITGASSGIGRAAAQLFALKGWNVSATSRSGLDVPLQPRGGRVIAPCLDVTDPQSIHAAVEKTLEMFGTVDVLVNNAGYALGGPLEGFTPEQLEQQFRTNVFGLAAVTRAVLPAMRAQGSGVVVNISSIGGRMAFPFSSAYHASKFAVEGLTESLRFELEPFGIRVKLVEPGGIRTDFISRSQQWVSHPAYEEPLSHFRAMTRSLDANLPGPEGVAEVILRAATDGTRRLRYPAKPGPYLLMHSLLPDNLWRTLITTALRSQAGQRNAESGGAKS